MKQSDQYIKIMDISLNLSRIGNWSADGLGERKEQIDFFLKQTKQYVSELKTMPFEKEMEDIIDYFTKEFNRLIRDKDKIDKEEWAERALTWANILQHRAKLA